jgi:hypothetical protein
MNIHQKILFVSLIFAVSVSAQKIKIKKGIVLIDKAGIPIKIDSEHITTKGGIMGDFHQILTFSNTSASNVFAIVEYKGKMMTSNGPKVTWLEISDKNKEKTNSVDIDRDFGGGKKGIVRHLMNKYQFFSIEGVVNQHKITEFFNTITESKAKEKANKGKAKEKEADDRVSKIRPFVKNDLTTIVTGGRMGTEVIGTVNAPDKYHHTRTTPIKIYDLNNNLIASATTDILSPVIVSLIDGSTFKYDSKYQLSGGLSNSRFLTDLVEKIVGKGYVLGSQINEEKEIAYQEQKERKAIQYQKDKANYEVAKRNSSNIYNKKGYVIDEKGVKKEGAISIAFEKIKNPADWGGMVNISSSYGNSLALRYIDKKGKKKIKSFSAKKGNRFCIINEDESEICYQGIKIQGNGLLGQAAATTFEGVGEVQYMKEVFKEGKVTIFQSTPSNKYVIKTEDQEKAFNFVFGGLIKKEKKLANLKEYLNGCDYGDGTYDEASFENIDKIKELINFYNNSCK